MIPDLALGQCVVNIRNGRAGVAENHFTPSDPGFPLNSEPLIFISVLSFCIRLDSGTMRPFGNSFLQLFPSWFFPGQVGLLLNPSI
jgi:hypothetical protein